MPYIYTKEYVDWNNYYEHLSVYIAYELEIRGYNNLNNLWAYNFIDDLHLEFAPTHQSNNED